MLKELMMRKFKKVPKTMIILGSGLAKFTENLTDAKVISYGTLFDLDTDGSIGHKGNLHMGYLNNIPLIILNGRKHYYEGVDNYEMRTMIQSFARIGVKNIIITNACGGMNETFKPGDIMIIEDHINMMGRNPLVGNNAADIGPRFVDMTEPYDLEFRRIVDEIAKQEDIKLQHGVYVGYLGPNYETKAEIKAFRMLGGDAVGMSTVPEVILARHANMRVLGVSLITNMSTGITNNKLSHEEVLEVGKQSVQRVSKLLIKFIDRISHE